FARAGDTASNVDIGDGASADQRAHARAIMAVKECHGGEEARARDLLRGAGRYRAKHLRLCQAAGMLAGDR
ncbi:MAG TPA: hypothetical protein VLB44_04705, partial [Kofleriaceae bacterium]|nr:hypothetical protein [Kofleriaceae bacterium]